MPKTHFLACLLLGMIIFLCGCQYLPEMKQPPAPPPVPDAALTYLYFSENGSYFERVQGYEFRAGEDGYTAGFYMANEEEIYPVPVDRAWAEKLLGFITEYGMMGWDGFSGSDSQLLDGTHFFTEFSFADGTQVQAGGYGKFPAGYSEASTAIDAHFMQLLTEDMRDW